MQCGNNDNSWGGVGHDVLKTARICARPRPGPFRGVPQERDVDPPAAASLPFRRLAQFRAELVVLDELQRFAVEAVAQAGRPRAVAEDVA